MNAKQRAEAKRLAEAVTAAQHAERARAALNDLVKTGWIAGYRGPFVVGGRVAYDVSYKAAGGGRIPTLRSVG